jgi:hypothetical protein
VPDKERQGRLAAQFQPRTRHNENQLIPQRRAAQTHQLVFHEASGGKYVPHAVLFDLDPVVIGDVTLSRRLAISFAREIL